MRNHLILPHLKLTKSGSNRMCVRELLNLPFKLDVFLLNDRITQENYDELTTLLNAQ